MSGAKSRNKGAAGERELARLLSDELGLEVTRNLLQTREGGHDLDGIPGWCLEVKRRAKVTEADKRRWWEQAWRQAVLYDGPGTARPAVLYRADRAAWRALVDLCDISQPFCAAAVYSEDERFDWTADISLPAFCQIVRESIEQTV